MDKKWYTSKTLWVNVLAVLAIVAQGVSGKELFSPEAQVALLGVINLVLRTMTKEPINWNGKDK